MSEKYKIRDQSKLYFVTFAVVEWVNALTWRVYKDIFLESLKYCQREKGLEVYAWSIMRNHIHLILGTDGREGLQNIARDFKKYSSVQICKAIEGILQKASPLQVSVFP